MYKYYLALWGKVIGVLMVLAPIVFDPLFMGLKAYVGWNIAYKGIICQILGLVLIGIAWKCDYDLR